MPLFSIAAAATFLPALLAVMGTRVNRFRVIPRRIIEDRATGKPGAWTARPLDHAPPDPLSGRRGRLMVGLALPALGLHLTSGDNRGVPLTTQATRGFALLRSTLGRRLAPTSW